MYMLQSTRMHHQQLPPVNDSIWYRLRFANTKQSLHINEDLFDNQVSALSQHSLLSMRCNFQYPETKHHWRVLHIQLFHQSVVVTFACLQMMVSGWCILHANTSPWAFLALERPASPSATGETKVHKCTCTRHLLYYYWVWIALPTPSYTYLLVVILHYIHVQLILIKVSRKWHFMNVPPTWNMMQWSWVWTGNHIKERLTSRASW